MNVCEHCGQPVRLSLEKRRARAEEARQRYAAGEKAVALADEYGVEITTFYRWLGDTPRHRLDRVHPGPRRPANRTRPHA